MTIRIRSLLPPGGFSNLVGHYVAALDIGSAQTRAQAEGAENRAGTCSALRAIGLLEGAWIHEAVGRVPTPPPPQDESDIAAWLGWLESVRTVSLMVLRPKEDRDLESFVRVPEEQAAVGEPEAGPRTLKRLLAELLYEQGRHAGRIA